eukprot:g5799.t2
MGCWGSKHSSAGETPVHGTTSHAKPTPHKTSTGHKGKPRSWPLLLEKETPHINDVYEVGKVLGRGQFGTTRVAIDKETRVRYACKSISKRKIVNRDDIEDVRREIEILNYLNGHENVCEFRGAFEDRHNIHIVLELCTGGELFDRIVQRGHYSEKDAAECVRTMLRVVQHCHDFFIIHRDLKPENFLLADNSPDATLKAIDFGLSTFFKEGQYLHQIVGSAYYVAPEVLRKKYSKEADIWSCGVILYILLSGYPPFYGETESTIFDAIMEGKFDMVSDPWPYISDGAKDCVKRMLVQDVSKRATAAEILKHNWMKENGAASEKPMNNAVVERLKGFTAMNKLKKEALKVIAINLPKEEIQGMKKMFQNIDTDHSGTITIDEFKQMLKTKGSFIPDSELNKILSAVDIDGNGVIDYEEFLAATMNLHARSLVRDEEQLMKAFKKFDTDGNGSISLEELREALREHSNVEDEIEQILADADKNQDGEIDFEEFRSMMLGQ